MITNWTNDEIEKILVQLDNMRLPFEKYQLSKLGQGLELLGAGSYANVYEAKTRKGQKERFAMKIIGFSDRYVEVDKFEETIKNEKQVGVLRDNFVQVYGFVQFKVWLQNGTEVIKVEKVDGKKTDRVADDCLFLQFMVMEKLTGVLATNRYGKHKLYPSNLASFDENEILKLAYDVGNALYESHQRKFLHRDVKLENIFYDEKHKCYKLGDFGIAKLTDNGMAQTRAFTKGYGAPEVVEALEQVYDNKVDIYSLGIVIYVLLNQLCFPGADGYYVNAEKQYSQGYILPPLKGVSPEVYEIVKKMCQFNPDDRYQSMEECLADINGVMFGKTVRYKEQHQKAAFAMATIFLLSGCVAWKLSFAPFLDISFSLWMYVYLIAAGIQGGFKKSKLYPVISTSVLVMGLILWVTGGFQWWQLVLTLVMWIGGGKISGVVAGCLMTINLTGIIVENSEGLMQIVDTFSKYQWVAMTLVSLAIVLLGQYFMLTMKSQQITSMYFRRNIFWIVAAVLYIDIGLLFSHQIGICGLLFCMFWMLREFVLVKLDSKKK